ncbi:hypothetical protein SAMD00019534_087200 [Acytostelium subglobosum LB1]|uniref:hypothetical protein n=1 Tax=Acytostelium subglobosum LB1 TaxID=1410327 RepID=UPI000644FC46|nr:hypothetical protein SAMD00019534_087200 [Acytostelium subglobosum LB1]GAM25545.1 hypothetical protein SAMD00019534_087200 [Acytostelium subglobosum LB1]|eukprot:XP_012751531.1 hypothetical protein SAMD00019534_087200 [Acytostelium subglobosum LB1]
MSKKFTIPLEPVIKDMGGVYDFYFDQNLFIETEINKFIKEYEGKRGDRDIHALQVQTINANATMHNIKSGIQCADQRLDKINSSLRELNNKMQTQLLKEDVYQSQRDSDRVVKQESQDFERSQIEEQLSAKRAVIDREHTDTTHALRDKYQIVL